MNTCQWILKSAIWGIWAPRARTMQHKRLCQQEHRPSVSCSSGTNHLWRYQHCADSRQQLIRWHGNKLEAITKRVQHISIHLYGQFIIKRADLLYAGGQHQSGHHWRRLQWKPSTVEPVWIMLSFSDILCRNSAHAICLSHSTETWPLGHSGSRPPCSLGQAVHLWPARHLSLVLFHTHRKHKQEKQELEKQDKIWSWTEVKAYIVAFVYNADHLKMEETTWVSADGAVVL